MASDAPSRSDGPARSDAGSFFDWDVLSMKEATLWVDHSFHFSWFQMNCHCNFPLLQVPGYEDKREAFQDMDSKFGPQPGKSSAHDGDATMPAEPHFADNPGHAMKVDPLQPQEAKRPDVDMHPASPTASPTSVCSEATRVSEPTLLPPPEETTVLPPPEVKGDDKKDMEMTETVEDLIDLSGGDQHSTVPVPCPTVTATSPLQLSNTEAGNVLSSLFF